MANGTTPDTGDFVFTPTPPQPPPANMVGIVGWLRSNLFKGWVNTGLTLLALFILYETLPPLIEWAFINATFSGATREACATATGACWTFISVRFNQILFGFYPEGEQWRPILVFFVGFMALISTAFRSPARRWTVLFLLTAYPVLAFVLLTGGFLGLEEVETSRWGGLTVTLVVSVTGIVASFPIGILLALGRRSNMPVARSASVVFIEVVRGVPLISVLFMASVMLPLFLPEGVNFNKLLRALVGVTLFTAAYMAEVVRAGLQAIPKGQYEGAKALGLSYWQMMRMIILPQALKLVIPSIVNSFISLFKDTTLVYIVGLFDVLEVIRVATKDSNWIGLEKEGYVFAALVFWVFCFTMSRVSLMIERRLDTGHRK
ncbi:amino acid ABC transporter permease [Zavarzinia sp.]|uniref:amino acid ABC transporter permease n=1 Tax=Zavarzinia sp. TaxID=2027920 RepID=UPI003567DCA9